MMKIRNTPNKTSRINTSEKSMQIRLKSGGMEMIPSCLIQNLV